VITTRNGVFRGLAFDVWVASTWKGDEVHGRARGKGLLIKAQGVLRKDVQGSLDDVEDKLLQAVDTALRGRGRVSVTV
jgi:hypothetical protein